MNQLKKILVLGVLLIGLGSQGFAATEIGQPAPDFSLIGHDGKNYKLSEYKGKTIVLEWFNNECPFIKRHYDAGNMQKLQKKYTDEGIVWFSVLSSAPGKQGFVDKNGAKKIVEERGSHQTAILLDAAGNVGRQYGAKTTPHMFIINSAGTLVYSGAIDAEAFGSEQGFDKVENYVVNALAELKSGKAVSKPSTKPYGCGVKY